MISAGRMDEAVALESPKPDAAKADNNVGFINNRLPRLLRKEETVDGCARQRDWFVKALQYVEGKRTSRTD